MAESHSTSVLPATNVNEFLSFGLDSFMPSFRLMVDLNLVQKYKGMLNFGIILSLLLIISSNADFHIKYENKIQLQTEVNLNNTVSIQTYPIAFIYFIYANLLALVLNKIYFLF